MNLHEFDEKYRKLGDNLIAGIDEAGRGPLAGPVVASAIILPKDIELEEVKDSKKLTKKKRDLLFVEIQKKAIAIGVGIVHEREIEKLNILGATTSAMKKAIGHLSIKPDILLIDGPHIKIPHIKYENIINGDSLSLSIASASIIAKVTRDKIMTQYDKVFPEYGFANHKGYGTKKHLEAIKEHKATHIHRKSFKPISEHLPDFKHYNQTSKIGQLGERLAASGLVKLGFEILEMNFNVPKIGELDIVHRENGELVISEVKTLFYGYKDTEPADKIDENKWERIMKASQYYIEEKGIEENVRFDVISVRISGSKPKITRIKNGLSIE